MASCTALASACTWDRLALEGMSASDRRVGRLPGLPSSQLGLQSLTGELDSFDFKSYLGSAEEREVPGPDVHSQMEARLRLGTKPCSRGL